MNIVTKGITEKIISRQLTMLGFGATLGLMGMGCEYGPPPEDYRVAVHPDNIVLPAEGGAEGVSITTDGNWNAVESSRFVKASPDRGKGDSQILIKAEENTDDNQRQTQVVVRGEENEATITIVQMGKR